jgi:hypothetical protein
MKNLKQIGITKTISLVALGLMFAVCLLTSCSKKNQGCMNKEAINYDPTAEEDDGSCLVAGKPGYVTIVAHAKHHDVSIISSSSYRDSVFIKFNSLEFPGDNASLYDLVIKGEKDVDNVVIKGLRQGNYFIFMTGWDSSIGERVSGGMPYSLTQFNGVLDLNVPVTE